MLCQHSAGCSAVALYTVGGKPYCGYHAEAVHQANTNLIFEPIEFVKRPSFPEIYMRLAHDLSRRSTCSRLQVGCVITSPDFREVYALGYNGGPVGGFNACKSLEPGKCGHIHAEDNACNYAPARVPKVAFVNYAPCEMCAIRMVNKLGFEKVYFWRSYRSTAGLDVLKGAGIETIQLEVQP